MSRDISPPGAAASNTIAIKALAPNDSYRLWLDLFRWVAAVVVLYTHAAGRFVGEPHDLPTQLLVFLRGFSHQAVMVFFVLSGYLVGGGLLREVGSKGKIDSHTYMAKRLARLWTVVLPALLLTWICNQAGLRLFDGGASGLYPPDIIHRSGLATAVCNAVFLQTVACATYGGNGPLWSLFNEFWYYVIWLLALLGFARRRDLIAIPLVGLALALLVAFTLMQTEGYPVGPWMLVWCVGVGIAAMKRPIVSSPLISLAVLMAYIVGARLLIRREVSEGEPLLMLIVDLGLAVIFGNLMLALKNHAQLRPPVGGGLNARIADFSFSLYCIHLPLIVLYGTIVQERFNIVLPLNFANFKDWAVFVLLFLLIIPIAYLFALLTERHTARVKDILLNLRPAAARRLERDRRGA